MDESCKHEREDVDTLWLIVNGLVVMTMQAGFALIEAGSIRSLNAVNILFKNYADLAVGGIAYWMTGYGISYGDSLAGLIGMTDFFPDGGNFDHVKWFFQLSFAATAATIDSGAVVERMKLPVYIGLSFMMSAWTYPVVCHWCWHSDGWLAQLQFKDFAGCGVVHTLGGTSALWCTYLLGPRMGMLGKRVPAEFSFSNEQLLITHSVFHGDGTSIIYGTIVLFIGWFGFNCGSTGAVSGDSQVVAGHVAFITTLGACFGAVTGSAYSIYQKQFAHPGTCSMGLLAGLVSITAAPDTLTAVGAACAGAIGAVLCLLCHDLLAKHGIDDPVGVVGVHLVAGIWGTLVPGIFQTSQDCVVVGGRQGLFYGGGFHQLGIQLLGVVAIVFWASTNTLLFWLAVERVCGVEMRVSALQELVGNDIVEHGIDSYARIKAIRQFENIIQKMGTTASHNRFEVAPLPAAPSRQSHAGSAPSRRPAGADALSSASSDEAVPQLQPSGTALKIGKIGPA